MTFEEKKLEEFDDQFDGLWLDGMHDYETEKTFDEMETRAKLKSFISQALKEQREEIVRKIDEYRCYPDEVHCTCMEALKDYLSN